jgi:hypothetical protein
MKVEVFGSYLQSQAALPGMVRELHPLAITISREVGAGGKTIADLLGQRLTAAEKTPAASPWIVFDSSLAKQVLEDHNLPPDLERFMTEDARLLPVEAIVEEVLGLHPSGWTLVQHTTQTILRLAGLGREQDHARRRYVRRFFNSEIDDPSLYDVTLNTGRLGFARTAETIAQLALQHRHALVQTSAE